MKRAFIVGSAGQDGTLLSQDLQRRGYDVRGVDQDSRIDDAVEVDRFVSAYRPDEIYYLAAFHHSSEDPPIEPLYLFQQSYAVHVAALIHFLEAMRKHLPNARLFYAASSLIFGDVTETPQTEVTPFRPTCAYGITKTTGLQVCRHYRTTYGVYAASGILYNHESPLRTPKFVSKKIVQGAWEIKRGERDKLVLGNLSAELDWGYAPDYVDAMRRILELDAADDFIIASGEKHSVREFVELVFGQLGLPWQHVEENRGVITRHAPLRVGDASKLARATGWRPTTRFAEMVRVLVDAEARTRHVTE